MSASNLNCFKCNLEKKTGMKLRINDLRSTVASQAMDIDPSLLNAVRFQLQHSNVKTT